MKALQRVAEGLGPRFLPHLDTDLLDTIVEGALGHKNRFVRETGFFTLGALCEVGAGYVKEKKFLKKKLGGRYHHPPFSHTHTHTHTHVFDA